MNNNKNNQIPIQLQPGEFPTFIEQRKNNSLKNKKNSSILQDKPKLNDLELVFNDINDKKIIKKYCTPLDENFEKKDIKLMLDVAGVSYPKDASKDELCKMLTKSIPRRILEGIITYGKQVGKGSAVSIVLIVLISSIFSGSALATPVGQAAVIAPVLYGVGTGIYKGVKRMLGLNNGSYKKVKDTFNSIENETKQ